jgi:hypothetical protein
MEYIKGRISFIGDLTLIEKNGDSFGKLIFVIRKKIDKKPRDIAFECYGKLAEKISKEYRLNDKVEVEYIIQSNVSKSGIWFTNLIAKFVDKVIIDRKVDINQGELL